MEIRDFSKKVCAAVEKELGQGHTVELKEIRKNNGVILQGMLILAKDRNLVPTIYLNSFWEAYEAGVTFGEVIRRLLSIYREDTPEDSIDIDFFRFYEAVKDRICYRLVRRKGNEDLLREVPYIEFLDLAICFYYAYQGEALGDGVILIHNSHMRMWKVNTAELLRQAQNNTPRLFPWECITMEEVLEELIGSEGREREGKQRKPSGESSCTAPQERNALGKSAVTEERSALGEPAVTEESGSLGESAMPQERNELGKAAAAQENAAREMPMRVLSNVQKLHGAACILYPEVLERIALSQGRGMYIIPSSIHEVILLAEGESDSAKALKSIIAEVNDTQVAPEEVLSDNLYYYDFNEKKIEIV